MIHIGSLLTLLCVQIQSGYSLQPPSVSSVHTFPLGTWVENLAVRSNGLILATAASAPQLWQINPEDPGTADLVATVPNHTALSGITEMEPDIFYIGTNNFTLYPPSVQPNASAVYRVDLSDPNSHTPMTPTLVANFPISGLLNGFTTLSRKYILIADSGLGLIWRLDIDTGEHTAIISDPLMRVVDPEKGSIGVNGVKVNGNYLYFTNSNQELLGRVPVSAVGEPTGPAEIVVSYSAPDDFVFIGYSRDDILVAGNDELRDVRNGVVSVISDSPLLAGSTAVALAGSRCRSAKKVYVSTSGGVEQYAALNVTVPGRLVEVSWV